MTIDININAEDLAILGDTTAAQREQLTVLLNANLGELMRFYKFVKTIHLPRPVVECAKGSLAPEDTPAPQTL